MINIFDLFNFKKEFEKIATKENFDFLRVTIKEAIKKQAKKAEVKGKEKMDAVVAEAIAYINKYMHSNNKLVQWIIDHVLIKGIRILTQSIYDDLKEVVEGL